jgi:hypothetical protein
MLEAVIFPAHAVVEQPEAAAAPSVTDELLRLAAEEDAAAFWRYCKADVIDALRDLRDTDPGEYQALRAQIKAANKRINITELDKLLRGEADGPPASQATELAGLAAERCELWHDADGQAYATLTGKHGERQHWRIDSTGFRDWLSHLAYAELGTAPATETIKATCNALAGRAKFDGPEYAPFRRVAKDEAGYWLDIGDERWRAILLTPAGWRVIDAPPVRFVRTKATRALPEPADTGDIARLWELVNIPEDDRLLVLAWLLECWRADTPYAVLEITGEQGAAKSTAQRILRLFVDPNEVALRGRPKTVEDVFVAAANAHLLSFENLSTLSAEHSDALCAIATGAGFAARQLFTNDEESLIRAHRPVALNGINSIVTRPDLLDRAICLNLPRLAERKTEAEIAEATQRHAGAIFTGLLDLFCAALRELPAVQAEALPLPRMADFALLGEAAARALGHPPGEFLRRYADHRREAIQHTIDASPVATAIIRLVENGGRFAGRIGDLLDLLNRNRPDHEATDYWQKSPRGLGDALRRYAPALAQLGIRAEVDNRARTGGYRHCVIERLREDVFFQRPRAIGNNVNNVTTSTPPAPARDVVDVVDVISPGIPAEKKEHTPARVDVVDVVDVDSNFFDPAEKKEHPSGEVTGEVDL